MLTPSLQQCFLRYQCSSQALLLWSKHVLNLSSHKFVQELPSIPGLTCNRSVPDTPFGIKVSVAFLLHSLTRSRRSVRPYLPWAGCWLLAGSGVDFAAYPTVVTEEVFAYAHSKNIKVHSNPLMFLCPLLFLCRSVCVAISQPIS